MHRLAPLLLLCWLPAQNPPLTPTSNLVLDTGPTQGVFAFSTIAIPAGVTVSFRGNWPVQIRCDGDARIDGQLDVDAAGSTSGPGWVTTGAGTSGLYDICNWNGYPPTNGRHAGLYGTAVLFDLRGGSPGGGVTFVGTFVGGQCAPSYQPGGGAGGTLVLEAQGRVDVHGRVGANGDLGGFFYSSVGSGGSLLLRGLLGVTVHPTGVVQATARTNSLGVYPPGIIRLDAYGQAPIVLGTVAPAPRPLTQPDLAQTQVPALGSIWELRVIAPRGDGVFLAAAFTPGQTTNAYGTVGIDLSSAITFAAVGVPTGGHDPFGVFQLPVPNLQNLRGLQLWVAGLDWYTALPPRYTNTVLAVVP
jgi:hypothetical protein